MARQPGSSGPGGRAPAHPPVLIGTNVVLGFSFQRFQRKKGHCTSLAMRAGSGHARRERPRQQALRIPQRPQPTGPGQPLERTLQTSEDARQEPHVATQQTFKPLSPKAAQDTFVVI